MLCPEDGCPALVSCHIITGRLADSDVETASRNTSVNVVEPEAQTETTTDVSGFLMEVTRAVAASTTPVVSGEAQPIPLQYAHAFWFPVMLASTCDIFQGMRFTRVSCSWSNLQGYLRSLTLVPFNMTRSQTYDFLCFVAVVSPSSAVSGILSLLKCSRCALKN